VSARPSVGVVGGGILGLTAAYRLAQQGVDVSLFERGGDLGGLVGNFDFEGYPADRFYHVVLPTDDRVLGLAEEVGLSRDEFRFRGTRVGFYDDGRLFSMSSLLEFARFPLLSPVGRARLALFVARCQRLSSYEELDEKPLEEWVGRICGERALDRLWRPLLDSKFDGDYSDLPATYLWARTKRMSKVRNADGEVMGWLVGGYQRLVAALERALDELGASIHLGASVDEIVGSENRVTGLRVDGELRPFDHVLCTLPPPTAERLVPEAIAPKLGNGGRYLGVVCLLLRTTRSISPYYTLNITDRRVPLTTVVETTHVVDPELAGGHLLYVTKYVDASHEDLVRPEDAVEADYLRHAQTIFPELTDDVILAQRLQRARIVEPVHVLGGARRLPDMLPAPGLAAVSTMHVYPEVVNSQAVIGVADRAVAGILERLPATWEVAA
jgi:protoporphyrinogen oxidase